MIAKKMLLAAAVACALASPIVSFANDAAGRPYIRTADGSRHTDFGFVYDPSSDSFISYIKSRYVQSVAPGSAFNTAQISVNNANIAKETEARVKALNDEAAVRESADNALNDRVNNLVDSEHLVTYDKDSDNKKVTLKGDSGTVVSNAVSGSISSGSTDAMTQKNLADVKDLLSNEISNRKNAVSAEKAAREKADDAISKKIGDKSELTSTNYVKADNSLSSNILILDGKAFEQKGDLAKSDFDVASAIHDERLARDKEDKAMLERIGTIGSDTKVSYIDKDASVSDNLSSLDTAVKGVSDSYTSMKDSFDQIADTEKQARIKADNELSDRIGTIQDSDVTYVSKDATVSDNLVSLDNASDANAKAIDAEAQARKSQGESFESMVNSKIHDLNKNTNEVTAGAAALAGLDYLPYENGQRISVASAVGNYNNKTAVAVGAKYNFNEDSSFHVSTTVGDGSNMVSGGVSFKFGPGEKLAREKRKAFMKKAVAASNAALNEAKLQNKWLSAEAAYYGDKNREMPRRYRMAKLIYNRLMHGETIDKEILHEYADELFYIRSHR